jgi:proteasome accessory factor C
VSETGDGRLGRRLRRILLLLPYAIKHPGVSLDELSNKFGVKKQDLVDDLNLVFMCGLPGYGPGDLIDVAIDEERVHIRMADYFGAPLRLTPAEALVLYAGGAALAELPEMAQADALKRSLGKLGRALGIEEGDGSAGVDVRMEGAPPAHLSTIQRALQEGRALRLQYLSASRGELGQRDVDPWGLIAALGRWYLIAWDHPSQDERMFRVDRVKKAELLEARVEVPADFDPERYRGGFSGRQDAQVMEIEISPAAARWFGDYYPVIGSTDTDDGWQKVSLQVSGERWAATLILKLGADVRNIQPPAFLEAAKSLAERITAAHG